MTLEWDVAVVGAGVVGTTLAWNLHRSGLSVALVDRGRPGRGSSSATFSWANASSKVRRKYDAEYFRLNQSGLRATYRLADELGNRRWFHPVGCIEVATGVTESQVLRADVTAMLEDGYEAYLVDAADVPSLEPAIRPDQDSSYAYYPTEGWVDGPALVDVLIGELADSPAAVVLHDEPVGFEKADTHIELVRLASGSTVSARTVVIAAGAWTPEVATLAGVDVPLVPREHSSAQGIVVTVDHPAASLRKTVLAPDVLVRPHRDGQLVLAGDDHGVRLSSSSTREERAAAAQELLRRARRLVPDLDRAALADSVVGIRPLPPDGVSVVGFLEPYRNLYVAVTHSGVTLAALLGELCAQELIDGTPVDQLAPFRPARFTESTRPAAIPHNAEVGK